MTAILQLLIGVRPARSRASSTRVAAPALLLAATLLWSGCGGDSSTPPPTVGPLTPFAPTLPDNFPVFQDPANNPTTLEGIALGRRLFYDKTLSRNQQQSCGSCHQASLSFGDDRRFSLGTDGVSEGTRNAPPLFNLVWVRNLFWDGRAEGLENQARQPVPNPVEMDLPWDQVVARLSAHPQYPGMFERVFGDPQITEDRVVQAIAQFERSLISTNSKYDRFLRGEATLTKAERAGERIFFTEQGDCFHCHGNILFTTTRFHDIGLDEVPADSGLAKITKLPTDLGKFKVPSLRNVEYTAPYMHDGRFQTLREVIDHYDLHVKNSPNLDPLILARNQRAPLLSEADKDSLEAFLKALSDPDFLTNPDFQDPFE